MEADRRRAGPRPEDVVNREYRKWWSPALGRDMELLVFGDRGTPVLVFPTSMGRFYQWEDFGLVSHMAPRIDAGWLQLWCVDSIDGESFYNKAAAPQDRIFPPQRSQLAHEFDQRAAVGVDLPVDPADLVVLAIGIVIAALGAGEFVAGEDHRRALRQ